MGGGGAEESLSQTFQTEHHVQSAPHENANDMQRRKTSLMQPPPTIDSDTFCSHCIIVLCAVDVSGAARSPGAACSSRLQRLQ
jgi:hypothetical protein